LEQKTHEQGRIKSKIAKAFVENTTTTKSGYGHIIGEMIQSLRVVVFNNL
jgi:hypothetical protein